MTKEKAAGILARAYLDKLDNQTYDLRPFEYTSNGDTHLKIPPLLRELQFYKLSPEQLEARKFLEENQITDVNEMGNEFLMELLGQ